MKTLLTAKSSGLVTRIEKTCNHCWRECTTEQSQVSPDFQDSTTLQRVRKVRHFSLIKIRKSSMWTYICLIKTPKKP